MPNRPRIDRVSQKDDDLAVISCRACGIPLMSHAERAIGIHIRCVAQKKYRRVSIPTIRHFKQHR